MYHLVVKTVVNNIVFGVAFDITTILSYLIHLPGLNRFCGRWGGGEE